MLSYPIAPKLGQFAMPTAVRAMKRAWLPAAVVLVAVLMLACSQTPEPTPVPTQPPEPTPTPAPTATPEPTVTPEPTPTPEPTAEPPDMLFRYTQAVQLLNAAQYEEAISSFDIVLRVLPDLAIAYNYRGVAHYHEEQYDLALEDFDKSIELKKTSPTPFLNRATLHDKLGNTRLAIEDLEAAMELYRESGNAAGVNAVQRQLNQAAGP